MKQPFRRKPFVSKYPFARQPVAVAQFGIKKLKRNGLTMVDLYCGAGIGAAGFKMAGYHIIDAIDNMWYAVKTYNDNIGRHARVKDMKTLPSRAIPYADVYVGGFPCKSWSLAGNNKGRSDERYGDLGWHFLRVVQDNQPKVFVLENVKGIVSKGHMPHFRQLLSDFTDAGYNIEWKVMDAYEYGVPQTRERVFAVGFRKDLGFSFRFPETSDKRLVLRDAIGEILEGVKNHEEYIDGNLSPRYRSRNRQRQWDEPSFTIVSQASQLPLYPEPPNYDIRYEDVQQNPPPRRFTVRECLRIQSVPDWFWFDDDKISLEKQYERCSGIPSAVAYQLGIAIAEQINGNT